VGLWLQPRAHSTCSRRVVAIHWMDASTDARKRRDGAVKRERRRKQSAS
jgi:hypothetical protein